MDDCTLDAYAELAARQAITMYGTYARSLNLTKKEFVELIRRIAEHAIKILNAESP